MSCAKCWSDAGIASYYNGESKTTEYHRLLGERDDNPCTPAEQCGEMHTVYPFKDGTTHCMCGKVSE